MEENVKSKLESEKEFISKIDLTQIPQENIDELEKLLARIKELAARHDHKEEIELSGEKYQNTDEDRREFGSFSQSENASLASNDKLEEQVEDLRLTAPDEKTLPPFSVMTKNGLKNFEGMKVSYYDKESGKYYLENGKDRLVMTAATYFTVKNPETLNAKEASQETVVEVTENSPAFVQGKTKIPEFSMITNHGLLEYKDMTVQSFNANENSYILSNGKDTLTVTGETFKELTADERFNREYTKDTPKSEKLIQSQYEDFFKTRDNTSYNFRHNLSVYCRKEANSPLDAIKISKEIISRMSKEEQAKTRRLLNAIKREDETVNELLVRTYMDAVKEVPLNEKYIKDNFPDKKIARPFYDTMTAKGELLDPASTLKVGDTVNNLAFNVDKIFGAGKEKIFQDLTVVSSSREGNSVILMDKNKSFYEVPRDELLDGYNKQQSKMKVQERKQQMRNRVEIER